MFAELQKGVMLLEMLLVLFLDLGAGYIHKATNMFQDVGFIIVIQMGKSSRSGDAFC